MVSAGVLAEKIRSTGFKCISCGSCCRSDAEDPGHVMVSSDEVRAIMAATGLSWGEIAVPYPEMIEDGHGGRYTLGWCVRRAGDICRFLVQGRCSIYASRPWICRTYPFMLDGEDLIVSACNGLGKRVTSSDALQIAENLLRRKTAEGEEARRVRKVLLKNPLPAGSFVVVDSEGMKVFDG